METKELASLVAIKNLKTVAVNFFRSDKTYTYKTIDETIEVDDFVVVAVGNHYKITKVVEVHVVPNFKDGIEYKWIVQKLDFSKYEAVLELEKEIERNLMEIEQENMVKNAKALLAERLSIEEDQLKFSLSGENNGS